jgi:hypothetical protein
VHQQLERPIKDVMQPLFRLQEIGVRPDYKQDIVQCTFQIRISCGIIVAVWSFKWLFGVVL